MDQKEFDKIHGGRFSGSSMGCPRSMALKVMGHKMKISKKLQSIFDEGQEHDAVLKEEAYEEWDDFESPDESKIFKFRRGDTVAEVVCTPDGIRDEEIVEFKGLSVNNYNSVRTPEDLERSDPGSLFRKYYNQVQSYCGAFKKPVGRLRLRNKRNRKTKDIMIPFDPDYYNGLLNTILNIKALIDDDRLPEIECSSREKKYCNFKAICKKMDVQSFEEKDPVPIKGRKKTELWNLGKESRALKKEIDKLESYRDKVTGKLKTIMRSHGQREMQNEDGLTIKYGIKYKNVKDKETIDSLVEDGTIPVEEIPEDYLSVTEVEKEE